MNLCLFGVVLLVSCISARPSTIIYSKSSHSGSHEESHQIIGTPFSHGSGLTRVIYTDHPVLRYGYDDDHHEYDGEYDAYGDYHYGDYHHSSPDVRYEHYGDYVKSPIILHSSSSGHHHDSESTSDSKPTIFLKKHLVRVTPIFKTVAVSKPVVEISSRKDGFVKYEEGAYNKPIVLESGPHHESSFGVHKVHKYSENGATFEHGETSPIVIGRVDHGDHSEGVHQVGNAEGSFYKYHYESPLLVTKLQAQPETVVWHHDGAEGGSLHGVSHEKDHEHHHETVVHEDDVPHVSHTYEAPHEHVAPVEETHKSHDEEVHEEEHIVPSQVYEAPGVEKRVWIGGSVDGRALTGLGASSGHNDQQVDLQNKAPIEIEHPDLKSEPAFHGSGGSVAQNNINTQVIGPSVIYELPYVHQSEQDSVHQNAATMENPSAGPFESVQFIPGQIIIGPEQSSQQVVENDSTQVNVADSQPTVVANDGTVLESMVHQGVQPSIISQTSEDETEIEGGVWTYYPAQEVQPVEYHQDIATTHVVSTGDQVVPHEVQQHFENNVFLNQMNLAAENAQNNAMIDQHVQNIALTGSGAITTSEQTVYGSSQIQQVGSDLHVNHNAQVVESDMIDIRFDEKDKMSGQVVSSESHADMEGMNNVFATQNNQGSGMNNVVVEQNVENGGSSSSNMEASSMVHASHEENLNNVFATQNNHGSGQNNVHSEQNIGIHSESHMVAEDEETHSSEGHSEGEGQNNVWANQNNSGDVTNNVVVDQNMGSHAQAEAHHEESSSSQSAANNVFANQHSSGSGVNNVVVEQNTKEAWEKITHSASGVQEQGHGSGQNNVFANQNGGGSGQNNVVANQNTQDVISQAFEQNHKLHHEHTQQESLTGINDFINKLNAENNVFVNQQNVRPGGGKNNVVVTQNNKSGRGKNNVVVNQNN